jgi:SAM-dependent methyltransferase
MNLIERERDTYGEIFTHEAYANHSPGEDHAHRLAEMAGIKSYERSRTTVLDAGTGSGKGALALKALGYEVRACDFVDGRVPEASEIPFRLITSLWDELLPQVGYLFGGKADYVYCCDVLEHIPPEFTMLTVRRLLDVARYGVFLSISFVPDHFGVWVGKPLHQTVQPYVWWKENIATLGTIIESRDLMDSGLFLVAPK